MNFAVRPACLVLAFLLTGIPPRYLAVITSKIFPGAVQDLWPKLINSETAASFFSHGKRTFSNLQLIGIMIYETKMGRFVNSQG